MVNGQNILTYPALYKSEITALVNLDSAKVMLSVGWSKKIIKYPTELGDVCILNIFKTESNINFCYFSI
jgi:hypothetical protein